MPNPQREDRSSRRDNQGELLSELASADCTNFRAKIEQNKQLLTLSDQRRNRLLHYAAWAQNFPLLFYLCGKKEVDRTVENENGETAADCLRDYTFNTHHFEEVYAELDPLPQKIKEGDIDFVNDVFSGKQSRTIRYQKGNTALHLAVLYRQAVIVKRLLKNIEFKEVIRLLAIRNCYGETALDMALRQGAAGQVITNYLNNQQDRAEINIHAECLAPLYTFQTLPPIDIQAVTAFSQQLSKGVDRQDLAQIEKLYLQTLCQLAVLICKEALYLLQQIALDNARPNQQRQIRYLLHALFNRPLEIRIVRQLIKEITTIADYFLRCYLQPQQYLVFVDKLFSDAGAQYGETVYAEGKIYLAPVKNLIGLMWVFIHEATHLVNYTYDFNYNNNDLSDGSFKNNFSNSQLLVQLGIPKKNRQLLIENKFVASVTLALLEGEITPLQN